MNSRIRQMGRNISGVGLSMAATALLIVSTSSPASAADTSVTFTVSAGGLAVSAPTSAALGAGAPGSDITNTLGGVTVTDQRAAVTAAWTAEVSSTDFTTGAATPALTISKSLVDYWSGPETSHSGGTGGGATPTFTPGQVDAAAAMNLSATRTAFALTGGVGNNSASWEPRLIVHVPATAVTGTYSGTVTHNVT